MKNVSQAAARVYAQALFDIGLETGSVGQIYDDLDAVYSTLNGLDDDLRTFFNLPQFRRDDKRRILNMAFEGKVGRPVLGLLNILVEKRRESLLDNVVEEFGRYRDRHEGRIQARVVSARKLDDETLAALQSALEQRTKRSVVLTETVNPDVIGGLRVNVGDRVLDNTVRRTLQDMRRSLAATHL
ncbi:MAG TPA: ATP synthase F1 subunit delta [Acidimicrobiia bacterium]|nr:ATP synthase F1 subunit delta [Acidimicrobiia bacterium]